MKGKENNPVKDAIKSYLDRRAETDGLFAQHYAKPNKNLDECFDYIIGEVKKKGNAVYMTDDDVFGLAVHYYNEDDIKIEKVSMGVRTGCSTGEPVKLTEEEKKTLHAEAAQKYLDECKEKIKAQALKKAEKARKAKPEDSQQLSLFG